MPISIQQLKHILVEDQGMLTEDQFKRLAENSKKTKEPLEALLVAKNYVSEQFMLNAIAKLYKIEAVDLGKEVIPDATLRLIPEKFARDNEVIIFGKAGGRVKLALGDYDPKLIESVEKITNRRAISFLASRYAIKKALFGYRGSIKSEIQEIIRKKLEFLPKEEASAESIVPILDTIVEYAVWANASDIHIEALEEEVLVRYRIDGILEDVIFLPKNLHSGIVARIKILSKLKIDEHRIPQDGRFGIQVEREGVDFRVSFVPTIFGEKVVMRVLVKSARIMALEELGFTNEHLEVVREAIRKPYGLILVTGPTGSGKTTSLYAMLHFIAEEKLSVVNISTIEDPIEYSIRRLNQIQINPEVGLTFAAGVRAILRQDPDIVLVGEVRDFVTAKIAVQATLIGRVILSSLHTNDATGATVRLLDLGIEPYLVSSTLSLVVAQRLVRKICQNCIVSQLLTEEDAGKISKVFDLPATTRLFQEKGILPRTKNPWQGVQVYRGKGCFACAHTGYKGRVGIFEILKVGPELRKFILERKDSAAIREKAIEEGMETMFQDGFSKVLMGFTTLEEVFRISAV